MKYRVIQGFIDAIEGNNYRAGDEFIVGEKTTKERIESLTTNFNAINKPLIEEVHDEEEIVDENEFLEAESADNESVALEDLTVANLKELATERGLELKSKVTKSELIKLLKEE